MRLYPVLNSIFRTWFRNTCCFTWVKAVNRNTTFLIRSTDICACLQSTGCDCCQATSLLWAPVVDPLGLCLRTYSLSLWVTAASLEKSMPLYVLPLELFCSRHEILCIDSCARTRIISVVSVVLRWQEQMSPTPTTLGVSVSKRLWFLKWIVFLILTPDWSEDANQFLLCLSVTKKGNFLPMCKNRYITFSNTTQHGCESGLTYNLTGTKYDPNRDILFVIVTQWAVPCVSEKIEYIQSSSNLVKLIEMFETL